MKKKERFVKVEREFWWPWRIVFLKGKEEKVREALLSWAEEAFPYVQGRAYVRKVPLRVVERLAEDLREGKPFSVRFYCGGEMRFFYSTTSVFLGAFYRIGETVRLGAVIARLLARGDHYWKAYGILTRGNPWTKADLPADEALFARAIAFPGRAPLFEELDWKRINLKRLGRYLPPDLAKPLAHEVRKRIRLRNLRVFGDVALYHDRDVHWLVFEGRAYPLKGEAWELAKPILRRRKLPPLERARLALTVGELGAWAG